MIRAHYVAAAQYNAWANARLYEAAFQLPEPDYRRDVGLFFKSLHGTLNHILIGDRIWLSRLAGESDRSYRLDAILYDAKADLALARAEEDARIQALVDGFDEADFRAERRYARAGGAEYAQQVADILAHFFNHQTHHRGQAHTALSILTGAEPPSLDMLQMQRGVVASDLRALAAAG